jgi:hypothetical protein
MHVRASYSPLGVTLGKLHLPTGRVAFEEVIVCLLNELDVLPARDDWEQVLNETFLRFRTYRTWT